MKRLFNILSLILLLFLMTAEDCSNSSSEMKSFKIQTEPFQDIEEGFVSDEVSKEAIHAFEVRAAQKVIDLEDLVTIYLDENLKKEFREQAKDMIYKVFYTNEDCHQFYSKLNLFENPEQVLLFNPDIKNKIIFKTNSINIAKEIQKTNDLQYSGIIDFTSGLYEIVNNDTILIDNKRMTLTIIVVKKEKDFGANSEKVWEVNIGDREI